MPNGEVLLVPLELGGTSRRLRFDMNAYAELEQYGVNVFDPESLGDLDKLLRSPKMVNQFLRCALLHEEPEITVRDVGALYTARDLPAVVEAISAAIADSLPQSQESEGNAEPAAAARRRAGTSSGP